MVALDGLEPGRGCANGDLGVLTMCDRLADVLVVSCGPGFALQY